jgi:hypothetical protein
MGKLMQRQTWIWSSTINGSLLACLFAFDWEDDGFASSRSMGIRGYHAFFSLLLNKIAKNEAEAQIFSFTNAKKCLLIDTPCLKDI